MLIHLLSLIAFMIVSFAVQGLSHFVINKDHFAGIDIMRPDPIIPLGLLAMVIQGLLISVALQMWRGSEAVLLDGVKVAFVFGLFLATYIVIVEPSKYAVPSITNWMMVEGIASFIQFSLFGLALGYVHQRLG